VNDRHQNIAADAPPEVRGPSSSIARGPNFDKSLRVSPDALRNTNTQGARNGHTSNDHAQSGALPPRHKEIVINDYTSKNNPDTGMPQAPHSRHVVGQPPPVRVSDAVDANVVHDHDSKKPTSAYHMNVQHSAKLESGAIPMVQPGDGTDNLGQNRHAGDGVMVSRMSQLYHMKHGFKNQSNLSITAKENYVNSINTSSYFS
jgi:hypothetical protein